MERDIEILRWILEQKFMTQKQVRQAFWKNGLQKDNHETYRRMNILDKEGLLKKTDRQVYSNLMYLVTKQGTRLLREAGRNPGLTELPELDDSNYLHDLAVTDIRILLFSLGYSHWTSERVLSKYYGLRRVPDGVIFNSGKFTAIEYESSQKSKRRYKRILLDYELDRKVDQVLYIVDNPGLIQKISSEAAICDKAYFVPLSEVQKDLINSQLKGISNQCSLNEFLGPAI